MSKTSILPSIKADTISAGRDAFGQWASSPERLHHPALNEDTGIERYGERVVTGDEAALSLRRMRPPSWPKHGYPISIDAQQDPRATGPLATASGTAGGILDHGSAEGGLSCFLGLFEVHGFSTLFPLSAG
jgi:hypothetical protein